MDIIRLLPDSVANQIAAGEVIQRPASVVKELVENAVDAGATEIQIIVKDAGRTLIQVIDNGRGMSATDARMAFERHATSKITQAADLFTLSTMGFRGEALPSICAIAQVELRTMARGETLGTRLLISGSRVEHQEAAVCTPGANFMVKNLFFNTPARRKFLRSDAVELGAIMREFERLALVNNHLRLSLQAGTRSIDLRPGSFKERITSLWKQSLDKTLLPIDVSTGVVKISGFVSHPSHARRRGALQYLITNGRNMRHPLFHKTILSCYEGIIAHDTQPNYFLKFEVDPASIDVNIHPTKNEIKFSEEAAIRSILHAAVRGALGKFASAPSIDFTQDVMPLDPARDGQFVAAPSSGADPSYNPFASHRTASSGPYRPSTASHVPSDWESLYTGFMSDGAEMQRHVSTLLAAPSDEEAPALPGTDAVMTDDTLLQIDKKYLLMQGSGGLVVADQHRAHVKVLYERFMHQMGAGADALAMQKLTFPQTLTLSAARSLLLESVEEEVARLGFLIAHDSEPGQWLIEGVPASLRGQDPADLLQKIIDSVADDAAPLPQEDNGKEPDTVADSAASDILSRVALVLARAAAIRRGQKLSPAEARTLMHDLLALPDHAYTPGGNPILRSVSSERLDSLFR